MEMLMLLISVWGEEGRGVKRETAGGKMLLGHHSSIVSGVRYVQARS